MTLLLSLQLITLSAMLPINHCLQLMGAFNLILSVILGLSSSNILIIWAMLELNMLSFLVVLMSAHSLNSSLSKYFIPQSLGSVLIMLGFSLSSVASSSLMGESLFLGGLALKLGMAPMHSWMLSFISELDGYTILVFLTVQKMLPFYLIFSMSNSLIPLLSSLNLTIGLVGMLGQKLVNVFLGYASLVSTGWLLIAYPSIQIFLFYLLGFFLSLTILMQSTTFVPFISFKSLTQSCRKTSSRLFVSISVFSLAGMPPTITFFVKMAILNNLSFSLTYFVVLLLILSGPLLFYCLLETALSSWVLMSPSIWSAFSVKDSQFFSFMASSVLLLGALLILSPSNSA